jgi:hypothetical protein
LHPVDQMTVAMLANDTAFVLLLASGDANGCGGDTAKRGA